MRVNCNLSIYIYRYMYIIYRVVYIFNNKKNCIFIRNIYLICNMINFHFFFFKTKQNSLAHTPVLFLYKYVKYICIHRKFKENGFLYATKGRYEIYPHNEINGTNKGITRPLHCTKKRKKQHFIYVYLTICIIQKCHTYGNTILYYRFIGISNFFFFCKYLLGPKNLNSDKIKFCF